MIIVITFKCHTDMITVVVGASGVGKTHWIRTQIAQLLPQELGCYVGLDNPIDAASLSSEFPRLSIAQGSRLPLDQIARAEQSNRPIYLEISDPMELAALEPELRELDCWRLLIQSPGVDQDLWNGIEPSWADATWEGRRTTAQSGIRRWRSTLTKSVFDPASLDTTWQELTAGAYGPVQRAKGIFELVDGRFFQIDFVPGWPSSYSELTERPVLDDQPDRFSAIEIISDSPNWDIIVDTLNHCQLSEAALAYYREQSNQLLGEVIAS